MQKSRKKIIKNFDPNGVGQQGKLFGLPFSPENSRMVVIPVPWDVTASFSDGASLGPKAVLDVSPQIDLCMPKIRDAWKLGLSMLPIDDSWILKNNQARKYAFDYIQKLEGAEVELSDKETRVIVQNINMLSENINAWVYQKSISIFEQDKIPVVLGGDHSSSFGLMRAIKERFPETGLLQIDAHADLRPAYEGFEYSHASIMYNALEKLKYNSITQVGIRDFCDQEYELMQSHPAIHTYFDADLSEASFTGVNWATKVKEIISGLPDQIYISLDVDGLQQSYCPDTGTPVPGGLSFNQLIYLLECIGKSGKIIVSFDVCEISGKNDSWNAIVGSKILYNLANITAATQSLIKWK